MGMKTIIEMAREAGLHRNQHNLMSNPVKHRYSYDGYEENLERFAELVRADEREACAKVCESMRTYVDRHNAVIQSSATDCVAAIRARGNT